MVRLNIENVFEFSNVIVQSELKKIILVKLSLRQFRLSHQSGYMSLLVYFFCFEIIRIIRIILFMWSVSKVIVIGHDVVLLAVALAWFGFACQIALFLCNCFLYFTL